MLPILLNRVGRRWVALLCMAALLIGLPVGCAELKYKERQLLFRIEPGTAGWYHGLPQDVEEFDIKPAGFKAGQTLHAWWWPATRVDAPSILYLHGVRWNLTGQAFRIEQLRAMGYSVLAIDYRGFGQSKGELPSEASVYEDARAAWERFTVMQPNANKRLIYGHSLGGAVAIDLAADLATQAKKEHTAIPVRGLIIESTFTSLADAVAAVADDNLPVNGLPVRWLLSQKFDSIDKIIDIDMPLLVVHGLADTFMPARFSEQLFNAASEPKRLLLVPGGTHNNSMSLGGTQYRQALEALMRSKPPARIAGPTLVHGAQDS
ncbi:MULTISPECIES: alpha/beta hydrolase [unclassified Pseudomonas]|uniref:alpha/beta hydrolase n=1 Tax=unclassified Pseudomonas TaxID=196821 RepID=UPI002AC9B815|nr:MULTISPECIES: alpha/beta hydrolase [unclassified Pseudomonas]MEB0048314.1 alpha/beta hydrolase [Pseudomonas sp. Dout3]MEB0099064.1 alpha/beta hydrolase [Pseudomonas sp. DC1.2]WPX56964.1 alpha/beta hydrolase [Pseudomonas sp. DC1.2]